MLEVLLPTRAGDAARASVVLSPVSALLWLAMVYGCWRVASGAWPAWVRWRAHRRCRRGLCVVCAYPVEREGPMRP
ncbi:MAG: hypothetical protein WD749_11875 [Phycisphaerales bacterium]